MTTMPTELYVYRAKVLRDVDGDTIEMMIDRGQHLYSVAHMRLIEVNAPEVRGASKPAGLAATAYTLEWLAAAGPAEWPFRLQTYKTDDFGRFLGTLWRVIDGADLDVDLITSGHAVPFRST